MQGLAAVSPSSRPGRGLFPPNPVRATVVPASGNYSGDLDTRRQVGCPKDRTTIRIPPHTFSRRAGFGCFRQCRIPSLTRESDADRRAGGRKSSPSTASAELQRQRTRRSLRGTCPDQGAPTQAPLVMPHSSWAGPWEGSLAEGASGTSGLASRSPEGLRAKASTGTSVLQGFG